MVCVQNITVRPEVKAPPSYVQLVERLLTMHTDAQPCTWSEVGQYLATAAQMC